MRIVCSPLLCSKMIAKLVVASVIFNVIAWATASGQIILRRPDGSTQQDSTNANFVVDGKRLLAGEKPGLGPADIAQITSYGPKLAADLFAFGDGKSIVRIITSKSAPTLSAPLCTSQQNPLFEFESDTPAKYLSVDAVVPQPSMDRSAPDTATVVVQVVVNATGETDLKSFKVLRAPSEAVALMVRSVAFGWRFSPAVKQGCRVSQLVQTSVTVPH